jgi:hypothetical protein
MAQACLKIILRALAAKFGGDAKKVIRGKLLFLIEPEIIQMDHVPIVATGNSAMIIV